MNSSLQAVRKKYQASEFARIHSFIFSPWEEVAETWDSSDEGTHHAGERFGESLIVEDASYKYRSIIS